MSVNFRKDGSEALRFGPYTVDLAAHCLRKGEAKIPIQEQPFRILLALLGRPGAVVTREELRRHLWGEETFVDFDQSLNSGVRRLRAALEDNPKRPVYIETIPRVGFRFCAPVESTLASKDPEIQLHEPVAEPVTVLECELATADLPATDLHLPAFLAKAPTRALLGLSPVVLALILLPTVFSSSFFATRSATTARHSTQPRPISSTAIADREGTPPQPRPGAQAYLNYGALLFNPSKPQQAASLAPVNAVDVANLEGRYLLSLRNETSYRRARVVFERALSLDANSTAAMVGLAEVRILQSLDGFEASRNNAEALDFAQRAVRIEPNLASAHAALAAAHIVNDWDYTTARHEFQKALALDPKDGLAHLWYAMFLLMPEKQYAQAEQQVRQAIQLDPFSLIAQTNLGLVYADEGRREEALAQYRLVLQMNPAFVPARFRIAQLLHSEGRNREARQFEPTDVSLVHVRPHARAHVAHALIHPDEEPGFANLQGAQVASLTPSLNLPEQ